MERREILQEYYRRKEGDHHAHDARGTNSHEKKKLDPIDPATVCRMKVEMWTGRCLCPWKWGAAAVAFCRSGTIEERPKDEQPPQPRVFVSEDAKKLLEDLRHIKLIRRPPKGRGVGQIPCGLFLVPKRDLHRLVFDARPANCMTKSFRGFTLFTLDDLLTAPGRK